jgi:hypothetical protein
MDISTAQAPSVEITGLISTLTGKTQRRLYHLKLAVAIQKIRYLPLMSNFFPSNNYTVPSLSQGQA